MDIFVRLCGNTTVYALTVWIAYVNKPIYQAQ